MSPWLTVIGIGDGGLGTLSPDARAALEAANIVFGGARHLRMLDEDPTTARDEPPADGRPRRQAVAWRSPLVESATDLLAHRGRPVAVLATGDPSWFGVARWLRSLLADGDMRILPAPSAFSLAASRLGWALEEVNCLSVHGRALETLTPALVPGAKLLVYAADATSPHRVAAHLARQGFGASRMGVLEHLGGAAERVRFAAAAQFDLGNIADLNTVAVECLPDEAARVYPHTPGLPEDAFRHDGVITKRVLRALALAALEPLPGALLWDVGAGSGSISVEWLRAARNTRSVAIEPKAARRAMLAENASALAGPGLAVVAGSAPAAFAGLPPPDAVFVGGGLSAGVFEAAFAALKTGGRMVAHAVTLEGEAILLGLHASHGGELLRVGVERAEPVGSFRGWRPSMPVIHWHVTKRAGA